MINAMIITPDELFECLKALRGTHMVPMIWGPPGVGKTETVKRLAKDLSTNIKIVHLVAHDVADLGGAPAHDHESKRMVTYPSTIWPHTDVDGDEGILFCDELSIVSDDVVKVMLRLSLEGALGDYVLPKGWWIVCAGNRPEDVLDAHEFNPAFNDRIIHFIVDVDASAWIEYATRSNVHPMVTSFIKIKPELLKAKKDELATGNIVLPSPRSWERVSDIVKHFARNKVRSRKILQPVITGVIGQNAAAEFFMHAEELGKMRSVVELMEQPLSKLKEMLPTTTNGMYSLCYSIAATMKRDNCSKLLRLAMNIGKIENPAIPMHDISVTAMSLLIDKALDMDIDLTNDPSFREYDRNRTAERNGVRRIA